MISSTPGLQLIKPKCKTVKYFIDTEFIEGFHKPLFGKRRHFIDLISIGVVSEDNRGFYFISSEYNYNDADQWVKENVIIPMYRKIVNGDNRNRYSAENFHKTYGEPVDYISRKLLKWIGNDKDISFYGYYSDYDWVMFCSMFGRMIDLPKGFPMYCRDLKQMMDEKVAGFTNSDFFTHFHQKEPLTFDDKLRLYKDGANFPKQHDEHNALSDAAWNKALYEYLTK